MRIRELTAAFICVLCLWSLACNWGVRATADNSGQAVSAQEATPVLTIEARQSFTLGEPLKFDWKLSNPGSKPVYFLSTLLEPQNNGFAEISIDSKGKILGIGFLRSNVAVGFPPYSFPRLQFKQIDPGASLAGSFVSDRPIKQLIDHEVVGANLAAIRIEPGVWKVRASIAYGYELQPVENAVKDTLHAGQEHPINAVVRWQRVDYSAPVVIRVQN